MPADISEEEMRQAALTHERTREYTDGKQVLKVITVPGKLVNIVVR